MWTTMGFGIRNKLKLMKAKKKWRERNSHYVGTKVIKKRFPDEIIEKTIKDIDYSEIEHSVGDSYQKYCQTVIDEENVDEVLKNFVTESVET